MSLYKAGQGISEPQIIETEKAELLRMRKMHYSSHNPDFAEAAPTSQPGTASSVWWFRLVSRLLWGWRVGGPANARSLRGVLRRVSPPARRFRRWRGRSGRRRGVLSPMPVSMWVSLIPSTVLPVIDVAWMTCTTCRARR